MDRDVGRITTLLHDLGLTEQTLVFFCSDNGAAQRFEGVFDSTGPLRGLKREPYEGGIRVPMIVRMPGAVPQGRQSDAVWYFADVLPTLADAIGVDPPAGIDGISVLPVLLGQVRNPGDRFLYWECHENGFCQAARYDQFKAVRPANRETLELYNLAEDVGETIDLAADNPHLVLLFEYYLATARTDSPNWPL